MLSKFQISFIKSLHHKKYRKENQLFIAEGIKTVTEFIDSDYIIDTIFSTTHALPKLLKLSDKIKLQQISDTDMQKISALTNSQEVLALIQIPVETTITHETFKDDLTLVLDGVQDPGNLGTIIRTADWFGFNHIICSSDTVEAYNPKVVQATMGSLSRITVQYTNLETLFINNKLPVYGALLDGDSIYNTAFKQNGLIILGNEGNGISQGIKKFVTHRVTIPSFGKAESLNVAISAAIICSEVRRKSTN